MAQSHMTLNMITREAMLLFKNSNSFIAQIDAQYQSQFARSTFQLVAETISTKEVIVLGAAAMIARNPIISRRWWAK